MAAACSLGPSIPVHLDKTDEEIEMEHAGDAAAAAVAEVEEAREEGGQ